MKKRFRWTARPAYRWIIVTSLFFFCRDFKCGDDLYQDIYIGGIVREAVTEKPIGGIEVRVARTGRCVCTDDSGKFGFRDDENIGRAQKIQFRDRRGEGAEMYMDYDTVAPARKGKILLDVLLKKK